MPNGIEAYDVEVTVRLSFIVQTTKGASQEYRAKLTAESVALELLKHNIDAEDLVITLSHIEV
jgi:hypothetical protein